VDIVDPLNQTEGVYIQSGAINTNRITIRGVGSRTLFGTNKIRAYFNGIPITNGTGTTEIDSYNADALASIEVVKGPKATQYGTNLGGTLILATKNMAEDTLEISNDFSVGSFMLLKNSASAMLKENDLSLFINYDHLQLDGFRDNSRYNRNNYLVTSNYKLNKIWTLGLLVRHTDNFTQIPSSLGETAFQEDPTQAAFTWAQAMGFEENRETLTGISLESTFSDNFNNTTSLFYTYLDHYEPRPFNILEEFTHSYGARSIFAKQYAVLGRNASLSFGGELYIDKYQGRMFENLYEENDGNGSLQGSLLSNNDETRRQLNVFVTTIIPLSSKWKTEVGLNVNSTNYDLVDNFNTGQANTSADRDFETILAPNFNLLYEPTNNWEVFGNVSRGFNYPSLEETLTPEGVVNPDIGPEIGWNYELGTTASFFERKLQLRAAAYLISIADLVVAERVGNDQFVGRNAGKTHNRGLEFGANATSKISPKLTVSGYATAEFNFHKFIDFVDGEEDFSGNDLTGVPDKKIAGGLQLQHSLGMYILGNLLHVGRQPITDANDLYSDSYTVINVKAGYRKTLFKTLLLSLSAGINNVADAKYASSILINASSFGGSEPRYFYPAPPVNFFGSLQLTYRL
jgi:iron complex outermembrane receptor protein